MFFEGGFPFGGGMPGGFPGGGFPGGGRGGPRKDVDTTKFYTILGVDKNADTNTIKKAYRKLALTHHPDRGGDAEKFKELTKAYEVLCDDEKRKIYDEVGEEGLEGPGGAGGPDPHDIFSAMFGGGGGRRGPQVRRSEDMNHVISVTLEQLYNGVTKKMSLNKEVICGKCKGEGSAKVKVCQSCDGQGKRIAMKRMGPMVTQQVVACPDCKGRGKSFDEKDRCLDCKGSGLNKEKKVLEVVITKGMGNNSKISFRGESDQKPGYEPGDVNFIVKEEAHKVFKRVGDHLTINHTVSLVEALTGFSLVVEHLDGRKLLIKSTPNRVYKPGDKLVVKEEGMPIEGRAFSKGHLVVLLDVVFPKTFDEETQGALKACLPPATNPPAPKNEEAYEIHYLEDVNVDLSGKKTGGGAGGRAAYDDDDDDEDGHHHQGPNVGCQQV